MAKNTLMRYCYVFLVLALCDMATAALSANERSFLIQLRDGFATEGPNGSWKDNDPDCDSWIGITCDSSVPQRLTEIVLDDPSASGKIPDDLSQSTALTNLFISADILGSIPDLSGLVNLASLALIGNSSSDFQSFPDWIFSLSKLKNLTLSSMNLIGPIPNQDFPPLVLLNIQNNGLNGSLAFISNLQGSLQHFDASNNQFNGALEPVWGVGGLQTLQLSMNKFNGGVLGSEIRNLSQLRVLSIASANLTGSLPSEFSYLNFLNDVNLADNYLSGDSAIIENLPSLNSCNVTINYLNCPTNNTKCCLAYLRRPGAIDPTTADLGGDDLDTLSGGGASSGDVTASSSTPSSSQASSPSLSTVVASSSTPSSSSAPSAASSSSSSSSASSATTSTDENCSRYQCSCSSSLDTLASSQTVCDSGKWTIDGSATNSGTVIIGGDDTVIIKGGYEQKPTATLQVFTSASINKSALQAEGPVGIAGKLFIALTAKPSGTSNITVTIITAPSITGTFSQIEATPQYSGSKCDKISASPKYEPTSVSVLLSRTSSKCNSKHNQKVGIAVGVTIGLAVIITIVVLAIVAVYLKRRKPGRIIMTNHSSTSQSVL